MFMILFSIIGLLAFCVGLGLYFNTESLFGGSMTSEELSKAKILIIILLVNLALTFPLSTYGAIISAYEHFVFQKMAQIARIVLSTAMMIAVLNIGYKAIGLAVVQTAFKQLHQIVTGIAFSAFGFCKITTELFFQNAIHAFDLLFFTKLKSVFGDLLSARAVLAGSDRTLIERAFLHVAFIAFEEKLRAFSSAKLAFCFSIYCHNLLIAS